MAIQASAFDIIFSQDEFSQVINISFKSKHSSRIIYYFPKFVIKRIGLILSVLK